MVCLRWYAVLWQCYEWWRCSHNIGLQYTTFIDPARLWARHSSHRGTHDGFVFTGKKPVLKWRKVAAKWSVFSWLCVPSRHVLLWLHLASFPRGSCLVTSVICRMCCPNCYYAKNVGQKVCTRHALLFKYVIFKRNFPAWSTPFNTWHRLRQIFIGNIRCVTIHNKILSLFT
jgi:hypothetical protein